MAHGESLKRLEDGLKQHSDMAYRICWRVTGREADAADAFQDACLTLIRRAGQFRQGTSLRAWICTTMHRAAIDLVRRRQRSTPMPEDEDEGVDEAANPMQEAERAESMLALRNAVACLSAPDRLAVELRYYEGLSDLEVATVLGTKADTASKRIRRALEKLRKTLGDSITVALLLSLFDDIARTEAQTTLPTELHDWMEKLFTVPPVLPATGWGHFKKGMMKMARNPLTYVAMVSICAVGVWLHMAKPGDGGESAGKDVAVPNGTAQPFKAAVDAELKELANSNNAFASALYAKLAEQEKGNLFFSPFSIRAALAMTYVGARGDTAKQMKQALRFTQADDRLHAAFRGMQKSLDTDGEASHTLSIVNSLWGQKGYRFLQPFLDTNATYYGGGLRSVDFKSAAEQARQTINLWVEDKTNKKIKDLVPPNGVTAKTRLVLVNAVYFLGFWQTEFDKALTQDALFHISKDETVKVKMMQHKMRDVEQPRFRYLENADLQAIELPYKGDAVSMVVLLPRQKDGVTALEKSLTAAALAKHMHDLDRAHKRTVRVVLPRWKMTWGTKDLGPNDTKVLSAMGMHDAFVFPKADFSGMNGSRDLYIGAVFHKAFVEVNEEGTEAAAATAVVMTFGARPHPQPVFRADHPFLFLIRDTATGTILFMGRVANPSA